MNKTVKRLTLALAGLIVLVSVVWGGPHVYRWYSQTYTISEEGLVGDGAITGDLIANHTQTVSAWINNSRASSATGDVTVNVVTAGHSFVEEVYTGTSITIQAGQTWNMPSQSWTPQSSGQFQVEVVFEEAY